ncbi:protein FAM53B isoform X1 [Esox lucius]|uniref:Family with sequence similarity 53 member B n=2 Tax=Esox lucius TaxID=8010 RepID=A0A3P8YGL0_ESOLU|nr:protein FAM53B isoform X1 [Esox lucius]XP_010867129.2 protein FAM53B isoform X1 [Esox lucius]
MVIIYSKTLEKKPGLDDVKAIAKELDLELIERRSMSLQGTAMFPCGVMESGSRWRDVGLGLGRGGCGTLHHQGPSVGSSSLENLWDVVPSEFQPHHLQSTVRWGGRDGGLNSAPAGLGPAPGVITSLLKDLSLGEEPVSSPSNAPPPKRQCRSLSCSEDLGGCRTAWKPQGSRVWTAVEKRRCHSGGSVQRGLATGGSSSQQLGFPAIQRSSSFSLPARSNPLTLDLPSFSTQKSLPCPFSFACPAPSSSPTLSSEPPRPFLYLSHEQICLPELQAGPASPSSSPDSTPEMERRAGQGGLARSRSQPCVLNDQKIGMKRRRPADSHKQRPSLDLAKMTQKLQNFHSLSCPGITRDDSCQSTQDPPPLRTTAQCETDFTAAGDQGLDDPHARTKEGGVIARVSGEEDPAILIEEVNWLSSPDCGDLTSGKANGKGREPLWAGLCGTRKDVHQLGGELDIEQIERN